MLRIGVDGGGSTTRAVVIDADCRVLGQGEAASSNHYSVGLEGAVTNIATAVRLALGAASLEAQAIGGWGFGLAGACTPTEQAMLRGGLAVLTQGKPVVVDEDAAAAQAGAFAGGPGVVCIAGTGANCYGRNAAGQRARVDGLGPLLGDRGSGYWIGEATLRTVCRAHDGVGPATQLLAAVLEHYKIASVAELVQLVYGPAFARDRIAGLVPVVLEHAATDAVAHDLLQSAGRELAETTETALKSIGPVPVAPIGGVLSRQGPLRAAYESALHECYADLEIIEARHDAVVGAALLVAVGS